MKTREEQIAEMAVIGCVRNPKAHIVEECMKCEFKDCSCNSYRHAERLYAVGYRKPSDTVREFAEKLKNRLSQFVCSEAYCPYYLECSYNMEYCKIANQKINELAAEYGAEVEE